ncbi:hypothetical protein F2P79_025962, partial [Pimephales promelas]
PYYIQSGGAGHQDPPITSREEELDIKPHLLHPERSWTSSPTYYIQRGGAECQASPITSREEELNVKPHLLHLEKRS